MSKHNSTKISVPRDNPKNKGVCHDVENTILSLFANNPTECYHTKELTKLIVKQYGRKYAGIGGYHIIRAVDQFFANRLVKRVAPSTFQSIDGPDEEYSERESGFVPEELGYQPRPANYTKSENVPSAHRRSIFNREVSTAIVSIHILNRDGKTDGETAQKIFKTLVDSGRFTPTVVKMALKKENLSVN